jgi:Zinc dependent phospholipase C
MWSGQSRPRNPRVRRWQRAAGLLLAVVLLFPTTGAGYSVQTHEQLIDLAWKNSIRPFLLARYPQMTESQLREAHAYAYGGSAIQDLGYYPFGKAFFSDLTHYVRTGDFVRALIHDARTPNELAFAVGALSHYVGDSIGHSEAVNRAVAVEFPKLERRYGPSVPYDLGEHQHVRTEFAFDINEISKHRFAPSAYLDHVGLKVSVSLMARAFDDTYGLNLYKLLGKRGPAMVRSYRFSVRRFLPRIAYAETVLHRNHFPADQPGPAVERLEQELRQADFDNGWDKFRKKAGVGTYLLAGVIVVTPKIGPLSDLAIKGPTSDTEEKYVESLLQSIDLLRRDLKDFDTTADLLPNRDLDTGARVKPGGYRLTDETYARLLGMVTRGKAVPVGLKQDILEYYADPKAPIATKKKAAQWATVQADLVTLQAMPTIEPVAAEAEAEAVE